MSLVDTAEHFKLKTVPDLLRFAPDLSPTSSMSMQYPEPLKMVSNDSFSTRRYA